MTFLANSNLILQISLKRGILGASTIILSKDIDKYAFMCGSNFYETDIINSGICTLNYVLCNLLVVCLMKQCTIKSCTNF